MAYKKIHDHDKAIADYTEAIRLKPDSAGAYYSRADAFDDKGDHGKAIADYIEVIRLKPDNAEAYYDRGIAYGRNGDYDKAIADYTEAIRLKPDNAKAHQNRGVAYWRIGDMSKAEDDFAQAKKISPLSLGQHTAPLSLWQRLMPWPSLVCLVILSAAAFLHWQRSRHWCLLALATGSLLAALGVLVTLLILMRLLHVPVETLPSGAVKIDTSLHRISEWLAACGLIIGTVGGIGAICWAIKLRRRPS